MTNTNKTSLSSPMVQLGQIVEYNGKRTKVLSSRPGERAKRGNVNESILVDASNLNLKDFIINDFSLSKTYGYLDSIYLNNVDSKLKTCWVLENEIKITDPISTPKTIEEVMVGDYVIDDNYNKRQVVGILGEEFILDNLDSNSNSTNNRLSYFKATYPNGIYSEKIDSDTKSYFRLKKYCGVINPPEGITEKNILIGETVLQNGVEYKVLGIVKGSILLSNPDLKAHKNGNSTLREVMTLYPEGKFIKNGILDSVTTYALPSHLTHPNKKNEEVVMQKNNSKLNIKDISIGSFVTSNNTNLEVLGIDSKNNLLLLKSPITGIINFGDVKNSHGNDAGVTFKKNVRKNTCVEWVCLENTSPVVDKSKQSEVVTTKSTLKSKKLTSFSQLSVGDIVVDYGGDEYKVLGLDPIYAEILIETTATRWNANEVKNLLKDRRYEFLKGIDPKTMCSKEPLSDFNKFIPLTKKVKSPKIKIKDLSLGDTVTCFNGDKVKILGKDTSDSTIVVESNSSSGLLFSSVKKEFQNDKKISLLKGVKNDTSVEWLNIEVIKSFEPKVEKKSTVTESKKVSLGDIVHVKGFHEEFIVVAINDQINQIVVSNSESKSRGGVCLKNVKNNPQNKVLDFGDSNYGIWINKDQVSKVVGENSYQLINQSLEFNKLSIGDVVTTKDGLQHTIVGKNFDSKKILLTHPSKFKNEFVFEYQHVFALGRDNNIVVPDLPPSKVVWTDMNEIDNITRKSVISNLKFEELEINDYIEFKGKIYPILGLLEDGGEKYVLFPGPQAEGSLENEKKYYSHGKFADDKSASNQKVYWRGVKEITSFIKSNARPAKINIDTEGSVIVSVPKEAETVKKEIIISSNIKPGDYVVLKGSDNKISDIKKVFGLDNTRTYLLLEDSTQFCGYTLGGIRKSSKDNNPRNIFIDDLSQENLHVNWSSIYDYVKYDGVIPVESEKITPKIQWVGNVFNTIASQQPVIKSQPLKAEKPKVVVSSLKSESLDSLYRIGARKLSKTTKQALLKVLNSQIIDSRILQCLGDILDTSIGQAIVFYFLSHSISKYNSNSKITKLLQEIKIDSAMLAQDKIFQSVLSTIIPPSSEIKQSKNVRVKINNPVIDTEFELENNEQDLQQQSVIGCV